MELTREQFEVLRYLEATHLKSPQAQVISWETGMEEPRVQRALEELAPQGWVRENNITAEGRRALQPYRVKRAVFIAAGFGSRLVPVTLNTPKPLVRVKGVRMIDTLLDAVYAAGIQDVTIVRGYLGEQFDQLLYKYPNLKFIENPMYNEANNISSAYIARELLGNAYVLEADLVLYNPKLIQKYQYCSNYLGVPTPVTDDWCFEVDGDLITKVKVGGENCCHMYGISYWTQADGDRLAGHIQTVFKSPGGKERYWDLVPLEFFRDSYHIEVRRCTFEDIIEIDTFKDLKALDSTYRC